MTKMIAGFKSLDNATVAKNIQLWRQSLRRKTRLLPGKN
jgi:hypothetical protein